MTYGMLQIQDEFYLIIKNNNLFLISICCANKKYNFNLNKFI